MKTLRIGTRGSKLAMWQADFLRRALGRTHPGLEAELRVISTTGDRDRSSAVPDVGITGVFTREIEAALLEGEVDVAVHSLKDLPTSLPDGLALGAVPSREDPADALICRRAAGLGDLPRGAEVLTGSPRRRAQLLHRRPDLQVRPVRGNVPTRLRKLEGGDADAVVLACAGLARLGLGDRITERLDPAEFVPAAGQGALGVEIRADDERVADLCRALEAPQLRLAAAAERAVLASLGAGCHAPMGVYGRFEDKPAELVLTGLVANLDGSRVLRSTSRATAGRPEDAEHQGRRLADALRAEGCEPILRAAAQHAASGQGGSR